MNFQYIKYHVSERVATICLNRPEKRNAFSPELVKELHEAFDAALLDVQVKVVILSAEGKAFCAGADLAYLQQLQNFTYQENLLDSQYLKDLYYKIYTFPKVVIAQVGGHALAGGCGLVSVCDFVFSVPDAKFGYTEVKIGFVPAIVMTFLVRKIGEAATRRLLLSGDLISAQEALQLGIISQIVNPADLATKTFEYAQHLCNGNSLQSMEMTKKMLHEIYTLSLEDALALGAETNAKARATEDCKKGIASFLNKEAIIW